MASGLPARQLPAVLARRQLRVYNTCRRLQSTSATQTTTQNPAYPLYPSVTLLLHQKGIPETEVSKIPASGPKGRLLKGDVLAYIGSVAKDYPAQQAAQLEKMSHLDLSNIKIAAPPAPEPKAAAAAEAKEVKAAPAMSSVAVSVSLAAVLSVQYKLKKKLGTTIPVAEFLARATELANEGLPRSKLEKKSADELFDEILGAPAVETSRGVYVPELNAVEVESSVETVKPVQEDIIDFLSAKKSAAKKAVSLSEELDVGSAPNVFSLTVPVGEEKRARTFLERVKMLLQVEPGRLVL